MATQSPVFTHEPVGSRMPPLTLVRWFLGVPIGQCIYVAAKLGIADMLAQGPQDVDVLAGLAGVNSQALYRVMRMLTCVGFFREEDSNRFSLKPLGRYLQDGHPESVRPMAILCGERWHLVPWTDLLACVQSGEPAFNRLHGTNFFGFLTENADAAAVFETAMHSVVGSYIPAILSAYDFTGATTIVDVGGGSGRLLGAILQQYPAARGILVDLPSVIERRTRPHLVAMGIADRCTPVGGDFFESVPSGADVYILNHLLHDLNDEAAATVLSNCRRSMHSEAKLLAVDLVVGRTVDLFAVWTDLEMLVNFGGRERTRDEFATLWARAGLALSKIIPTQAPVNIIEGVVK
jgi:O-methyltransferase domain